MNAVIKNILFLATTAYLLFHSPFLEAKTIRLWVMPNEAVTSDKNVGSIDVHQFLKDTSDRGIIIDNDIRGMLRDAGPDWEDTFVHNIIAQKELLRQLEEFIKISPEVENINVEFLSWVDAYHRFLALTVDDPPELTPDIIQVGSTWIATFADKGLLLPLNKYFDFSTFYPSTIESTKINGKDSIYALPWFIDVRLIYYWKKYFPRGDESFSSWENFRDALKNIRGAFPFVISIGPTWNLLHDLAPWVWGAGSDLIEKEKASGSYQAHWSNEKFISAIKYLQALVQDNLLYLPQNSKELVELNFVNGRNAAIFSTSDIINRVDKRHLKNIGIALPPGGPAGRFTFIGGSDLALTKFTIKNDTFDISLKLLRYLSEPNNQFNYAEATTFLPALSESMDLYLSKFPRIAVFKTALENGRSYPSIPEWGEIFENDNTRSNLFDLWNDMAQGRPISEIEATLASISEQIDQRLRHKTLAKYAFPVSVAFSTILILLALTIYSLKKRQRNLIKKYDALREENRKFMGRENILEAKIVLMERNGATTQDELNLTKQEHEKLKNKIEDLSKQFKEIEHKIKNDEEKRIPNFSIDWNGNIFIEGDQLRFENATQAKRLIEHVVRNSEYEKARIHYLKGFALFEWGRLRADSNPKRIFDTAIAKINVPLKKKRLPPLLRTGGRNSLSWEVVWDQKLLKDHSDIIKARSRAEIADKLFCEGKHLEGINMILESIALDPKCIEAYSILQEYEWKALPLEASLISKINGYFNSAARLFDEHLNRTIDGMRSAKAHVDSGDQTTQLSSELESLEMEIAGQKEMISNLFTLRSSKQPLYLTKVVKQLSKLSQDVDNARTASIPNIDIWSQITQDKKFLSILNIPHVQKLVNNFRDQTTNEKEDPRLVKLAMVLMLKDDCISELKNEGTSSKFFKIMEKNIRKQFKQLEQEIRVSSREIVNES